MTRHKGSISQINVERDRMAAVLYREAKRIASWPTSTMRLCEIAANMPTKEFYISEEFAVRYVRKRIYAGVAQSFTNKFKQKLYEALFDRVVELRKREKYREASLPAVVQAAIMTPAPCLGLTPRNIYMILPKRVYPLRKKKRHL